MGKGKVKFHTSIILAFVVFGVFGYLKEFAIVILFVSIHEFSHIFCGIAMGAKFEEILITPVGQRAIIRNTDMLPFYNRIFIILSGPFVSIIIGFILKYFSENINSTINFAANANLYIGIFNLLPFLPLDGGNALLQIFGKKFGILKSASFIIKLSKTFGIAVVIIGVIQVILFPFNLSLFIIGIYIIGDNKREYINTAYRFYKNIMKHNEGAVQGRCLEIRNIMVNSEERLGRVLKEFSLDYYYIVCYVENGEIVSINQCSVVKAAIDRGMGVKIKSLK